MKYTAYKATIIGVLYYISTEREVLNTENEDPEPACLDLSG